MNNDKRFNDIDDLLKQLKSMESSISANMIWNANPGVDVPEYVDASSSSWQKFIDDVGTYFELYYDCSSSKEMKDEIDKLCSKVSASGSITGDSIELLRTSLNKLRNRVRVEIERVEKSTPASTSLGSSSSLERKASIENIIIQSISEGNDTKEKLTQTCGITATALTRILRKMVEDGALVTIGPGRHMRYQINAEHMTKDSTLKKSNDKVFIVHGHDEAVLHTVESFLYKIGLEPIILREQPDGGNTIIEKFEKNSDVAYAIILYTACDEGKAKEEKEFKARARQNVVFEHGYFAARLGRKNVAAIVADGVETPGDISGIVYIPYKGDWKLNLMRNMADNGLSFDWSKA